MTRPSPAALALGAGVAALPAGTALRARRRYDFRGRTVLVTGGSRGLGLCLAREFGRAGARVAICARDAEALERALGIPYKLAARVPGVAPGLTARVLGVANRLLPQVGGIGAGRARGSASQSALSPSWLTALGDRAAVRNNELSIR